MEKGHYAGLVLGVALIAAAGFWLKKKGSTTDAAAAVAAGAVGLAGDVATGTVLGIGDAIGLPRTNMTACEQAKAEGRSWDASFACPAGDFLSYMVSGTSADAPTITDYPIVPPSVDTYYPSTDYVASDTGGGAAILYRRH
ncbi:hypothetical protein [Cupriavidus sp. CuC1]|uniref:hypothetical protein n=1 Tax=Cupriavidus sp. CuC1 TaxID=3373131 RepID=UPI0037D8D4B7